MKSRPLLSEFATSEELCPHSVGAQCGLQCFIQSQRCLIDLPATMGMFSSRAIHM